MHSIKRLFFNSLCFQILKKLTNKTGYSSQIFPEITFSQKNLGNLFPHFSEQNGPSHKIAMKKKYHNIISTQI